MNLSIILSLIFFTINPMIDSVMVIDKKNITIDGKTSIGSFSCKYEFEGKNDTLYIDNLTTAPYCFSIPVEAFRCGNFMLNKDFQSTLKAEEYPEISVEVLDLKQNRNGKLKGVLKFSLVGKYKILNNVDFKLEDHGNRKVLTTEFVFHTTEFDIIPPKKLGGLIKTDDTMLISVDMVVRSVKK